MLNLTVEEMKLFQENRCIIGYRDMSTKQLEVE